MAFSSVITSVNSTLHEVDNIISYSRLYSKDGFKEPRFWLRNLKTFVDLCARKLGKSNDNENEDTSLGSLLIRIEDAVHRFSQKLLSSGNDHIFYFKTDIQPLKKEIDEWYIGISYYTGKSNSLMIDEIVEMTEFILENLVYLDNLVVFSFYRCKIFPVMKASREIEAFPFSLTVEAFRDHMKFLTNFCHFVTKSGVQHRQIENLLTHTEAVVINAAHLCFLCGAAYYFDEEWRKVMHSKISTLLQKIKPMDRQVYETYNQALSCSKCPKPLHAPTPDMDDNSTIVIENFVDSLIYILWGTLRQDIDHVFLLKDHGQVLYEALRSLRSTLKKLPHNIDQKSKDIIRAVVCDAGILVCSFYQKNVGMDLCLEDLLGRMKHFLAKVEETVPQTSIFNAPRINVQDFVNFLLENLLELTSDEVGPVVKSHVQTIKEELLDLRSFLEETVMSSALWNHVLKALYQLEFLIDHLVIGDISNSFSMQLDSIMEDLRNIKANDVLKNFDDKRKDIKIKEVSWTHSHVPLPKTNLVTTDVVGFRDEAKSIMGRLTRGSKQLQVIAIVGMGGCGKTTLATKVYNDPSVVHHFHVRAWCPVSQTLNKKALLLELLNQIHSVKTEDDLAEKLRRHLKGKRYLIFLDDIWTSEAWNNLKGSFPDDSTGSRIILTSRSRDTAPLDMVNQEPHYLRPLTQDESLELLQRKLLPKDDNWPLALYDLRMQIVEKCQGLPLAIVIVVGLLAATDQQGWKELVDGLSSEIVSSSLELSYQHLPDYLKPCLLYFGSFPEDQEVPVRRLIRLWIAEGFVRKSESKSVEDVAEDYMMNLIGRSLIMVAKQRFIGGVKSCRIHDLLHDFCLKKAEDEYLFHLVKGHNELLGFNEPCNLRRLCIHSKSKQFKESKLFCPRARSLRFFSQETIRYGRKVSIDISFIIHIFKLVRVLDLEGIYLGKIFPSEIELLVQLRYLAIRGSMKVIPSSIGNLSMLETLIVDPCGWLVSLPNTIWNLRKLNYVFICFRGGRFPIKNLDNNSILNELDMISGVAFMSKGSMEKQMRKFPNIRKLKCTLLEEWDHVVVPDFLSRLESLNMSYKKPQENIKLEFCVPANVKKLTLVEFGLPWSKISTIGKLPNLEVLKLLYNSFKGETWEMEEGEFPKLRYLKLGWLGIVGWTASCDDQFPCLEKLVLAGCRHLEKMPCYCLGSTTPTLEMIEVSYCSKATRRLVKKIEEQRVSLGNSDLKVIIKKSIIEG